MDHNIWRELFGPEIEEGRAFWRARKERLAALRALDWEEIPADQALVPSLQSERRFEPLSEEWFEDLDKSIDEITRLFEELRVAPPEPEDVDYIQQAEDGLTAIEKDLTKCFTNLEVLKRRFRGSGSRSSSSSSSGDDLFKQFRPRSLDFGGKGRVKSRARGSPGRVKWFRRSPIRRGQR